jgi:hypothetical protein
MGKSEMGGIINPNGIIVVIDGDIRVYRTLKTMVETVGVPFDWIYSPDINDALGIIDQLENLQSAAIFVIDCCMDGSEVPNTMPIVKYLRQLGFTGPILAQSGEIANTEPLMEAGANDKCEKLEIFSKIKELLPIESE